jgi:hypothetical protein
VQRESQQMVAQHVMSGGFDQIEHTEATVIRIRTADAFSIPDKQVGMAKARAVIDRFEEEETKLAQLSGDQMRMLRSRRDSAELAPPPRAPGLPGVAPARSRRPTDEPTVAHTPLTPSDILGADVPPPTSGFDTDESTKLRVQSRDPASRSQQRPRQATPMPGTVHGRTAPPSIPPPMLPPPPQPGYGHPPMMPPQQPQHVQYPPQNYPPQVQQQQPMFQPPPPQQGGYPTWGGPPQPVIPQHASRGASPTAPDMFDRPMHARGQAPQVAGFGQKKPQLLQPWMLIVGALVMAGLAFAITRLLLS